MGDETHEDEKKDEEPKPSTSKQKPARKSRKRRREDDYEDDYTSYDSSSRSGYSERSRSRPPRKELRLDSGDRQSSRASKAPSRRKDGRTKKQPCKSKRSSPEPRKTRLRRKTSSVNTLFTRMSSKSRSESPGCKYCGHRHCGRRSGKKSKYVQRRKLVRTMVRTIFKKRGTLRLDLATGARGSEGEQSERDGAREEADNRVVAAQVHQLQSEVPRTSRSPLLLKSYNNIYADDLVPEYSKVTPEMIYQGLRYLAPLFPADYVPFRRLLCYILRSWPVNPEIEELTDELNRKLAVAEQMGMVEHTIYGAEDTSGEAVPSILEAAARDTAADKDVHWRLRDDLLSKGDQEMCKNHVTKFWLLYSDTMKPVCCKRTLDEADDIQPFDLFRIHSGDPCCSKRMRKE